MSCYAPLRVFGVGCGKGAAAKPRTGIFIAGLRTMVSGDRSMDDAATRRLTLSAT